MDLSHPQSNLFLEFYSYTAATVGGDSIPRSRSQSFPFQSLNEQPDNRSNDDEQQSGDEEQRKEEFSMLGHPICPKKRLRRYESSSSCSSSAKKLASDPDLDGGLPSAPRATSLSAADPDLFDIMENERWRHTAGIELIASENFICRAVLEALCSHVLTNKYSEGILGAG